MLGLWMVCRGHHVFSRTHTCIALRIEWCKSRARAARFSEEVELLQEEMQRVLRFFTWQEGDWKSKGELQRWEGIPGENAEGLSAYAQRQATLRKMLHAHFTRMWAHVPEYIAHATGVLSHNSDSTAATPTT